MGPRTAWSFAPRLSGYDKRQEWVFCDHEDRGFLRDENVPASFAASQVFGRGAGLRVRKQAPAETRALAAQVIERLVDAFDDDHFHTVDALLGLVGRGDDRALESKLGGFPQPLLTALHGPDFTRQADFAKHKRFTI